MFISSNAIRFNNVRHGSSGFTLIELMIVVVIVAVLAMIAVPSYQEQIRRGKRAEGKAFLLDLASRQERFYTQYAKYTDVISRADNCAGEACGLGLTDNTSPEGHYTATVACEPDGQCTSYTLTATPQTADEQCTTLTYTSAGVRGSTPTDSEEYCWR